MAPSKPRQAQHDETKSETPHRKTKNGNNSTTHQSNAKLRKTVNASSKQTEAFPGADLLAVAIEEQERKERVRVKEVGNKLTLGASRGGSTDISCTSFQIEWSKFPRDFLRSYRRHHRLNVPDSFASEYRRRVLSQRGSIGLYSPTMAKNPGRLRQSEDELNAALRKHSRDMPVSETDFIVDFIHKVRSQGAPRPQAKRWKRALLSETNTQW